MSRPGISHLLAILGSARLYKLNAQIEVYILFTAYPEFEANLLRLLSKGLFIQHLNPTHINNGVLLKGHIYILQDANWAHQRCGGLPIRLRSHDSSWLSKHRWWFRNYYPWPHTCYLGSSFVMPCRWVNRSWVWIEEQHHRLDTDDVKPDTMCVATKQWWQWKQGLQSLLLNTLQNRNSSDGNRFHN